MSSIADRRRGGTIHVLIIRHSLDVVEMLCMPRIRLQTPAQINMQKTQQKQPRCFVTILTHASALFHMLNVRHDAMCLWTSAATPVRGSLETFDERGIFCSHRSK
jgi:hypothetical protein